MDKQLTLSVAIRCDGKLPEDKCSMRLSKANRKLDVIHTCNLSYLGGCGRRID